jgi:hypothetical protein
MMVGSASCTGCRLTIIFPTGTAAVPAEHVISNISKMDAKAPTEMLKGSGLSQRNGRPVKLSNEDHMIDLLGNLVSEEKFSSRSGRGCAMAGPDNACR